jgi:hypothetical protein
VGTGGESELELTVDSSSSPRRRLFVAFFVTVVVLGGVVVVATRGHQHSNTAFSISAVSNAISQETVRMHIAISQTRDSRTMSFVAVGEADFRRRASRFDIFDATGKKTATSLTIGSHAYSRLSPGLLSIGPKSKPWTELDSILPTVSGAPKLNPLDPLAGLRANHAHIQDLGTSTIDGRRVHHYRADYTEQVTPAGKKAALTTSITTDLFVAQSNRLVRMDVVEHTAASRTSQTEQFDFSDYGLSVNISAPPPNQVYVLNSSATIDAQT